MQDQSDARLYLEYTLLLVALYGIFFSNVLAPRQDVLGWTAFFVGLGLIYKLVDRWPALRLVLLLAFGLRAITGFLGHYFVELPDSMADVQAFDEFAQRVAAGGLSEAFHHFTARSFFFAWMIGVMYGLVGYSPLLTVFVNVFLGTGVVLLVYLVSREFSPGRPALICAAVAAFFPPLILYSAVFLREAGWVFFATLAVWLFIRWIRDIVKFQWLAGSAMAGVVTGMFHAYGAVLLFALILIGAIMLVANTMRRPSKWPLVPAILLMCGAIVAGVFSTGIGLGKVASIDLGLDWLSWYQDAANRGRAAYPESLIVSSWPEMFWKLPARIVYLLFAPFPWMIDAGRDWIGFLDGLLYLALIGLIAYRYKDLKSPNAWILLAVLLALLVVVSLTVGNYGTGFRHRAKLVAFLILLLPTTWIDNVLVRWGLLSPATAEGPATVQERPISRVLAKLTGLVGLKDPVGEKEVTTHEAKNRRT